jgi:splicing factor U2AF subunit
LFILVNDAGHLPSVPQTMPGMIQNTLQFGTTQVHFTTFIVFVLMYMLCTFVHMIFSYYVLQFGVLPLMPAHAMTQQVDMQCCLLSSCK